MLPARLSFAPFARTFFKCVALVVLIVRVLTKKNLSQGSADQSGVLALVLSHLHLSGHTADKSLSAVSFLAGKRQNASQSGAGRTHWRSAGVLQLPRPRLFGTDAAGPSEDFFPFLSFPRFIDFCRFNRTKKFVGLPRSSALTPLKGASLLDTSSRCLIICVSVRMSCLATFWT
jgi:hypothetical protein